MNPNNKSKIEANAKQPSMSGPSNDAKAASAEQEVDGRPATCLHEIKPRIFAATIAIGSDE